VKRTIGIIALAPLVFWLIVEAGDVVRGDPKAFETPLFWAFVTWLLYIPVFGPAGALSALIARRVRFRSATSFLVGGMIAVLITLACLGLASVIYGLPVRVWPTCAGVAAVMGATLVLSAKQRTKIDPT
jgi:heme A synthase